MRVVGLGASAGGMEALITLLSRLPDNTGAAFVIILHLSPDHDSIMDELLARYTDLPVQVADRDTHLRPNHIYIISRDSNLTLEKGMLMIHPREPRSGLNLPIDQFFHSLGSSLKEKAIGVILSGTGTDGSRGARTIKEAGGLVLVQSPQSSKFDGMPQTIISQKLADRVMNPTELARTLEDILQNSDKKPFDKNLSENGTTEDNFFLDEVIKMVKEKMGIDFSDYREGTLIRRLTNRMLLHGISEKEQYLELLRTDEEEAGALYRDFLIGVTRFFRDEDAFKALQEKVLPELLEDRDAGDMIRIWVPACSTGEEAYTIAFVLEEYLRRHDLSYDYKIFGTDVDAHAIALASNGAYAYNHAADIPRSYLSNYFTEQQSTYFVKSSIRDKMLFAVQNLLDDPPFIHMDLISCRNALIYFKSPAQRAVLSTFHFSLQPDGYLLLGPSESLGDVKNAYKQVDSRWNIYQKNEGTHLPYRGGRVPGTVKIRTATGHRISRPSSALRNFRPHKVGRQEQFTNYLLDHYLPAVIFVNKQLDIIYIQGNVEHLFSFPRGSANFNVYNMVGTKPAMVFKNGIVKARKGEVIYRDITFTKGDQKYAVDLLFKEVAIPGEEEEVIMIEIRTKHDIQQNDSAQDDEYTGRSIEEDHVDILKEELKESEEFRSQLVDEIKQTNEELEASNRELIAANEELQSTNEELQSVNQELYTVNNELQFKNEHLSVANSDMSNLLRNTGIGTIFLDAELRIRRYTPAINQQFNLLDTDIGRPITHFSGNFEHLNLSQICRRVYDTLESFEKEIVDLEGRSYLLRILPYRTTQDQIEGLVVSFINVDELTKAKVEFQDLADKYEAIFRYAKETIIVLSRDGKIIDINKKLINHKRKELIGKRLFALLSKSQGEKLDEMIMRTLEQDKPEDITLEFESDQSAQLTCQGCVIPVLHQHQDRDKENGSRKEDTAILILQV